MPNQIYCPYCLNPMEIKTYCVSEPIPNIWSFIDGI
jgi:hypothetical protein